MESAYEDSLHAKKNMRKKGIAFSVFFLRCIALQDPQRAKE